jgi:cation:H+ antiporter
MANGLRAGVFLVAMLVSLSASWLLVSRLERVAARLGLSEALLGMVAALAADAPEITAAVAALSTHARNVGVGVIIGSNVFNLAALLGVSAVVAGQVVLHRRVVALGGSVALAIALICLATVLGLIAAPFALALALIVLITYIVLLGAPRVVRRLPLPARASTWLALAVDEEELELIDAIHPSRGGWRDAGLALFALVVVVAASIVMERSASDLGHRYAVAGILVGGLVLAAVTSLPNAVAGIYLGVNGRGSAALSTSLNSNAINVAIGLLIPASFVGIGAVSPQGTFVAAGYLALTLLALTCAYVGRGLQRSTGALIVLAYLVVVALLIVAPSGHGALLALAGAVAAAILGVWAALALALRAGAATSRS